MKSVAIIILNWKQPQLTVDTIDSVLKIKNSGFTYQIVLVDNGSPDDSLKILKNKYQKNKLVKILDTGSNLGYAGGNNFGIDFALKNKFDYLMLLNNDVIVDPNFLQNLFDQMTNYDLVGPKIYFAPGFEYHHDRYSKKERGKVIWSVGGKVDWDNIYGSNIGIDEVDHGQFDLKNEHIDFVSGCCLMAKKEVFQALNGLDDQYFMYFEDVDFCHRAKLNGFSLAYIPNSIIWHINSGSTKGPGDLQNYFITRNRLYFAFRFAKPRTKFAVLRESIKFIFSKSHWQRQAVFDFYLKKLNKGSWK